MLPRPAEEPGHPHLEDLQRPPPAGLRSPHRPGRNQPSAEAAGQLHHAGQGEPRHPRSHQSGVLQGHRQRHLHHHGLGGRSAGAQRNGAGPRRIARRVDGLDDPCPEHAPHRVHRRHHRQQEALQGPGRAQHRHRDRPEALHRLRQVHRGGQGSPRYRRQRLSAGARQEVPHQAAARQDPRPEEHGQAHQGGALGAFQAFPHSAGRRACAFFDVAVHRVRARESAHLRDVLLRQRGVLRVEQQLDGVLGPESVDELGEVQSPAPERAGDVRAVGHHLPGHVIAREALLQEESFFPHQPVHFPIDASIVNPLSSHFFFETPYTTRQVCIRCFGRKPC